MTRIAVGAIPQELRDRHAWVCWRYVQKPGKPKPDKPPFDPRTDRYASSTDPETWVSFEEALKGLGVYDGIGIACVDQLGGADLDGCTDEGGNVHPDAMQIVRELDSYTERSPSRRGLRVFFFGTVPPGGNQRMMAWGDKLEVYSHGRYLTCTGDHLAGTRTTVEHRQLQFDALHARLWPKRERRQAAVETHCDLGDLSDRELLDAAFRAKNGAEIRALFEGDTGPYGGDDSRADAALCAKLAFYAGPNTERLERLTRASRLVRAKWNTKRGDETYIERECRLAIERHTGAWYTPRRDRGACDAANLAPLKTATGSGPERGTTYAH